MDNSFFNFTKTQSALSNLSVSLGELREALADKKEKITKKQKKSDKELEMYEAKLEIIQNASQNTISQIDNIMVTLDKVLENDVASNNNN